MKRSRRDGTAQADPEAARSYLPSRDASLVTSPPSWLLKHRLPPDSCGILAAADRWPDCGCEAEESATLPLNDRLTGVVLAGGASRRLGVHKAAVEVGGRTMLQRAVDAVGQATDEVMVITAPNRVENVTGAHQYPDQFPGEGPVGGILTAFAAAREGALFVVACDMPWLSPPLLKLIAGMRRPGGDAVAPRVAGRPEPLCAIYEPSAEPFLRVYFEAGGRQATGALAPLQVTWVDEAAMRGADADLASFINVNAPEDLRAAEVEREQRS